MVLVRNALRILGRCLVLGLFGAGAAAAERGDEGSPFSVGGHVELDFESEDNFNLDDGEARDVATLEAELKLKVTY